MAGPCSYGVLCTVVRIRYADDPQNGIKLEGHTQGAVVGGNVNSQYNNAVPCYYLLLPSVPPVPAVPCCNLSYLDIPVPGEDRGFSLQTAGAASSTLNKDNQSNKSNN